MEVNVLKSTNTDVSKYVFTKDDIAVEAVLYKYSSYKKRTVICCSTQCGCPMGCGFCGTGDFFVRSLSSEEIVSQVTRVMQDVDCEPSEIEKFQIMFMSMGEPILNINNVILAMETLSVSYPNAQLLISTVAPGVNKYNYYKLINYAISNDKVGIQFSVHESNDINRGLLIKGITYNLKSIGKIGEMFAKKTSRQPYFNYCVHSNNNSNTDVQNLKKYLNPDVWQCTLSVICEKDESVKNSIDRQLDLISKFKDKMVNAGYSVRVFNPAGQDDIGGGCGQLWYFQDWISKKHEPKVCINEDLPSVLPMSDKSKNN